MFTVFIICLMALLAYCTVFVVKEGIPCSLSDTAAFPGFNLPFKLVFGITLAFMSAYVAILVPEVTCILVVWGCFSLGACAIFAYKPDMSAYERNAHKVICLLGGAMIIGWSYLNLHAIELIIAQTCALALAVGLGLLIKGKSVLDGKGKTIILWIEVMIIAILSIWTCHLA